MPFLTGHAGRSARILEVCSRYGLDSVSRWTRTSRPRNPASGLQQTDLFYGLTSVTNPDKKYQYPIQNPYHQSASATQAAQFKRLYQK